MRLLAFICLQLVQHIIFEDLPNIYQKHVPIARNIIPARPNIMLPYQSSFRFVRAEMLQI